MKHKIVVGSKERLEKSPDFQKQRWGKAEAIRVEFALRMAGKGLPERLRLWVQMRRELSKLRPSDKTLWLAGW